MSKVAKGSKAPEHEPRVHDSFWFDTIRTGKLDLTRIGDGFMAKMITSGMVVMVVGVMSVAQEAFAADPLIEIYVNGEGDVVDVRDGTGPLKPTPVQSIAIGGDGLERILGESITIAEVVSKDGDPVAFCCPTSLGNVVCGSGLLYSLDQAGEISVKTRVGDKWVESTEEPHTHAPSEIQSLKTHLVEVFKDQQGNQYGMVISGIVISPSNAGGMEPSMWFNPDTFSATDE